MPVERVASPAGGVNVDAAPDYLANNQAEDLLNMLPRDGKVFLRGPIRRGTFSHVSDELNKFRAIWFFGDIALYKILVGGVFKYYKVDLSTQVMTDVTASLAKTPWSPVAGNPVTRTERFGDAVYGPIDDTNAPGLGKWDGNTTVTLNTNAPFKFTDLKVHAQRLFTLGGTVPGVGGATTVNKYTLYFTDPQTAPFGPAAGTLAEWQDKVSGLVNQIVCDADDEPVGLAKCGPNLAILGSRSIHLLTGSGSSNFAIRTVTKNWGCASKESIVEVDNGFWFMSDRGYCFSDGIDVTDASDSKVKTGLQAAPGSGWTAAALNDGWILLANTDASASAWMLDQTSRAWARFTWQRAGVPTIACRSLTYPLVFQQGYLGLLDDVTNAYAFGITSQGIDSNGADYVIPNMVQTRLLKLASPSSLSTVRRLLIDYAFQVGQGVSSTATHRLLLNLRDGAQNSLGAVNVVLSAQHNNELPRRQRFALDLNVETDTMYATLELDPTAAAVPLASCEIYDMWVEFDPAQQRGTL